MNTNDLFGNKLYKTDEINGFEFIYTYRTKNENRTIAVWYEFNHGLSCEHGLAIHFLVYNKN